MSIGTAKKQTEQTTNKGTHQTCTFLRADSYHGYGFKRREGHGLNDKLPSREGMRLFSYACIREI